MLYRIFFYLIGYSMAVSGGINMIAYLNVLAMGYDWHEYLNFIAHHSSCYLFPIGIIIVTASIYFPQNNQKQ